MNRGISSDISKFADDMKIGTGQTNGKRSLILTNAKYSVKIEVILQNWYTVNNEALISSEYEKY